MANGAMKKQFNKKRQNSQGLKKGENMWLEVKNIYSNQPSKKLDHKRYRPFRITKNIEQEVFQLELPEGQIIHNVFNEDLCHMPSPSIQSIHLHGDTAFATSTIQACLPQWPSFLQHALIAVMQQSRYSIFDNGDTPI